MMMIMMSSHHHTTLRVAATVMMMVVMGCFLETIPVAGMSWDEDMDMNLMMTTNPVAEMSSREELVDVAGYGEEKLSKVTISGKVVCHHSCTTSTTADHGDHAQPNPVSGASVAVFCGTSGKSKKSWAEGATDEYGDFLIDLPSHLHAIPNLEKVCLLKVLKLPKDSECHKASKAKQQGIKLQYIDEGGARSYTANTINLTTKSSKTRRNLAKNRKHIHHVY